MIYPIVLFGDPVLKRKAQDIQKGAIDLDKLIEDMFETMDAANGVGLAAPQIGMSIRLFVVDTFPIVEDEDEKGLRQAFVNPVIIEESGDPWKFEEGCLSIPNVREDVSRQATVKIRYQDAEWNQKEMEVDGMLARVIQHEYDHIEGILFTDHISNLKKKLLKKKLENISKGKVSADYRVRVPSPRR